jgi:hypothetical protein
VSLPPVGSLVVYFPQGHSEQVSDTALSLLVPVLLMLLQATVAADAIAAAIGMLCCFNRL